MDIRKAYDIWSDQYDTDSNKTRDLEGISLRTILENYSFNNCLEIGCGTGKNTKWLITKASQVTAVDLSAEMLTKAKQRISSKKVEFVQADITKGWTFARRRYDLVTFSLVLEHIENLNEVFKKAYDVLNPNGLIYVGELHPFKQYSGSKARFEMDKVVHVVTCFNHNVSDFTSFAKSNCFKIVDISEFFDDNLRTNTPRILTIIFRKNSILQV